MKNNKKPLYSIYDIDKKILPFFSIPVILKKIDDQKKNKDLNQLNPQKKLIYKIIKLNEKLVKITTSIKNYNLNLDSILLTNVGNNRTPTATEFILFIRNNSYYNLKFHLSNILYKIEKFIPVLKFHSLLYNINLFAPKKLFKPQPYIRFTYRIIQINNYFKNTNNYPLMNSGKINKQGEESNILFKNYKSILPSVTEASLLQDQQPAIGKQSSVGNTIKASESLETRKKVLIKINNYNDQSSFDYSIIQLHKFENGRSIKYILLKLNNLLNEIDNIINLKNKLIKGLKNVESLNKKEDNYITLSANYIEMEKTKEQTQSITQFQLSKGGLGSEGWLDEQSSNQSVKNLRLKIKKINNNNNNIEISPLLVEEGMVKENIIKIEKNIKSAKNFNVEKDIIKENSNPVDLLYFNNNLKKPVINQYLKSMSTYNMITNGSILYYSNIIGFNFKNRIRAYLPFIKSVPVISMLGNSSERLTSPYSIRGLRKVVGSLDKGKFSVFGRGIENNKLINNIYKFLYLSFKSMYCLISKPVFIIKSNKIIIQLFYFLIIPKIFKHIKSKTNYINKNKKKIYREFIDRRKKQALANLFEMRLKEKEDALKIKYFLTLPSQMIELKEGDNTEKRFIGEQVNSNTPILNLDPKSAKFLIKSYNKELLKIRKTEEKNSGVKFDKFGRVILKSLENKLLQKGLLLNNKFIKNNKIIKNNNKGRWLYKMFFKRFNNLNNNLHILRIPRKWAATRTAGRIQSIGRRGHQKLFKYLALTYLNIFKFKVSHPMLNRINFKLKWFQKELIKDNSYLFSYNKGTTIPMDNLIQGQSRGDKTRRNKFNSSNKINWFLFKKLFWNISLSKKIIPNAKILLKLGIPQWSWPYSGIKKKGYPTQVPLIKKGYPTQAPLHLTQSILSYSWPFSLLISPTIIKINKMKKNFNYNNDLNSELGSDSFSLNRQANITNYAPISVKESKVRIPVSQNQQSRYKIRELYTKRYHLMKLANINLIKLFPLKFEKLCEVLNSIFNKPVELDLIRLHYPYHDSNILVRMLAFVINKMKLRRITRRLFNKAVVKSIKKINNKDQVNIIPTFLSGMTIKVAGRLMKYRVIPRKTVKIVRRGSSSIGKVNYLDVSRFTSKNRRGSFTITIKSGQNFFN